MINVEGGEHTMEYVYGALVLHSAGHKITEEGLKKVLTAAGVKVDETRVKALTAALEGVNIDEALKTAVAMPAAPPAAAPAAEKKDEKKKEEKKEEEKVSEEEAAAGLGALFGL
jgi:large subunit ribosomal protein L12